MGIIICLTAHSKSVESESYHFSYGTMYCYTLIGFCLHDTILGYYWRDAWVQMGFTYLTVLEVFLIHILHVRCWYVILILGNWVVWLIRIRRRSSFCPSPWILWQSKRLKLVSSLTPLFIPCEEIPYVITVLVSLLVIMVVFFWYDALQRTYLCSLSQVMYYMVLSWSGVLWS